ncbi:uncharacterized protein J3R85_013758 [Psidium guajava]|nr:uncharacterized protein J3R85_013758 [Psidium guajava]
MWTRSFFRLPYLKALEYSGHLEVNITITVASRG